MTKSMPGQVERVIKLCAQGDEDSLKKATKIVNALDTHRMNTNSAAAHRHWATAYNALNDAEATAYNALNDAERR